MVAFLFLYSNFMSNPTETRTEVRFVTVNEHQSGQRVDNFLMAQFRTLPKSRIYQMIRKGEVRVNKGRVKPETRIDEGDIVRIPPVSLTPGAENEIPIFWKERLIKNIVHEDERLLVINKPAGIAVHKGSGLPYGVIEILRAARPELEFLELVHRLDKDTSGCLVLAKSGKILRDLQKASMNKRYLCLVKGYWDKGRFDQHAKLDIENREHGERHVVVSPNGKEAHTRFDIIEHYPKASLLEAKLFTGRTHQIRVHAASMGFPLLGDERYGDPEVNKAFKSKGLGRIFLHASSLMIDMPPYDYAFSAPLPDDLNKFLNNLR